MTAKINMQRGRKIIARIHGNPNAMADPDLWVYFYRAQWFEIYPESTNPFQKVTGDVVKSDLDKYPLASVTVVKQNGDPATTPDILKGRKYVTTITVNNENELVDLIMADTGIEVKSRDLTPTDGPGFELKDTRPIGVRATEFLNRINRKCKPRFFAAYPVSPSQQAISARIRAMINRINNK